MGFVLLLLLSLLLVICQYSVTQFCSRLAMDKIDWVFPANVKKQKNKKNPQQDSFIKWHFKQAIDSFIFIMHMAKQIHLWWRNCSSNQKIHRVGCDSTYILIYSPPPPTWMCF